MWGETVTSTFTNKEWAVGSSEPAWTKSGANATSFESASPSRGVQTTLTNIKNSGLSLTNSTIKNLGTIKSIKLVVSANGTGGSISSVKVGETTFKNGSSSSYTITSSNGQEVTFSNANGESGDIVITFGSTATSKSLYVKSITVEYTTGGGSTPATPYTVTFDAGSNGTCSTTSLTESSAGAGVTLPSCTANTNYTFQGWSTSTNPTSADAGAAGATYKPSSDCTLHAYYTYQAPSHEAKFFVNGQQYGETQSVAEGSPIVFPAKPDDINNKTFVGWAENTISGTTSTAPTFVTTATMGNTDKIYHAVFALMTPGTGGGKAVDCLTRETTGVDNGATSYSAWQDKSATDGSPAVYAGQSAGSNNSIQLRSTNPSGIITTTTGGNVSKVSVEWESHSTNGRVLDVYGSNEAYTDASDLYDNSKKGTKLGSITYGTSTELSITDNYKYVGIRSNNGALYLSSITIEWISGTPDTYSEYCTTVDNRNLSSITVQTAPTKVTYFEGDKFDPAGLVISADYGNDETEDVAYAGNENKFSFDPSLNTALTTADNKVTITYGNKSVDQAITVNEVPKYTVTILTPENGSLIVKNGSTNVENEASLPNGTKLTIECTPADGYKFRNWQAMDGTTHTYTKTFEYTINGSDVSFRANFEEIPEYTITYYVNGVPTTETLREGASLNFPENPTLAGKVFRGWITDVKIEDSSIEPEYVSKEATAVADATYFAVFATENISVGGSTSDDKSDWKRVPHSFTFNDWITPGNEYIFVHEKDNSREIKVFTGTDVDKNTVDGTKELDNETIKDANINIGYAIVLVENFNNKPDNTKELSIRIKDLDYGYMQSKGSKPGDHGFYLLDSDGNELKTDGTLDNHGRTSFNISYDDSYGWVVMNKTKLGFSGSRFRLYGTAQNYTHSFDIFYRTSAPTYSDFTTNMDVIERKELKEGQYFTICYPYAVHPKAYAGATAYNVVGKTLTADGKRIATLELEEVAEESYLAAGMPYFMVAGETTFTGYHSLNKPATQAGNHNGLYGVFEDFAFNSQNSGWDENEYYVINSNLVKPGSQKSGVYANRAFIKKSKVPNYTAPSESAARFVIELEEGTLTELDEVELKPIETSIYNLQGQRMQRLNKGVNIINGRKVIR